MAVKKNVAQTRAKVSQVLTQAKESLKLLETLEKETLAKARNLVRIPKQEDRRRKTNDRILASLKRMGVATRAEIDSLHAEVERLRSEIETLRASRAEKAPRASSASAVKRERGDNPRPAGSEAFPQS